MASMHTSRDFEAELRELRAQTLAMGARCERSLRLALEAFWTKSSSLAEEVERIDKQIDRDEMDIDALVLRVLALRQPVAHDLRFLATALKLVTDLERVGDEAVNIAERAREGGPPKMDATERDMRSMGRETQEMLRGALDSFVEGSVDRANEVLGRDDLVDELYGRILDAMTAHMTREPDDVPAALRVMKVAKYIERIADHATNIAEKIIFMVEGDDVRHARARSPNPSSSQKIAGS